MSKPAAAKEHRKVEDTNDAARWKDSVKRELNALEKHQKASDGPRPFHVNPHKLECVTRNIGSQPLPLVEESAKEREELRGLLERSQMAPRDILKRPATTSQEYGWYAREAVPEPFSASLHRSGEVKFAIAYAKSFHVGPFGKTQPMAR